MYLILNGSWQEMPFEASIPLVLERPSDFAPFFIKLISTEPFGESWPLVRISVLKSTPRLDYLESAGGITVVSKKFVEVVRSLGVNAEFLPVEIFDRRSNTLLSLEYYVLHFLDFFPAIDMNKSSIQKSGMITRLYPAKELEASGKLMIYTQRPYLVLIHESVEKIFRDAGLTGCELTSIES